VSFRLIEAGWDRELHEAMQLTLQLFSQVGLHQHRTILLHNGVMRTANRAVRQSVTLPANVAAQVRRLAKARRLSANRMLLELIENGMEAEKRKQLEFFDLAERFRNATDPAEVERLGDQMGRMVFGS
jgi:hypothetical protein